MTKTTNKEKCLHFDYYETLAYLVCTDCGLKLEATDCSSCGRELLGSYELESGVCGTCMGD